MPPYPPTFSPQNNISLAVRGHDQYRVPRPYWLATRSSVESTRPNDSNDKEDQPAWAADLLVFYDQAGMEEVEEDPQDREQWDGDNYADQAAQSSAYDYGE